MAGFFGLFDYSKEGPGVYANGPAAGPFKTFFSILGRKFWKTIQVNMLYVLLSLPIIAIALFLGAYIFPAIFPFLQLEEIKKLLTTYSENLGLTQTVSDFDPATTSAMIFIQLNVVFSVALVGIQVFVLGPVQAGVTYLFRNFAKEEPVFIWFDFKEQARKNLRQSLLASLINIVVFIVICVNIWSYSTGQIFSNEILNGVLTALFTAMLVIFSMMQMYIYPMMVTFKLTIKQMYKNAFLFTVAKLPSNLGIFLVSLFLTLVIPFIGILFLGTFGLILCLLYYILLGFGFNLLVTNFHVYRQLKKYMIDPMLKAEEKMKTEAKIESENDKKDKSIFKDTNTKRAD